VFEPGMRGPGPGYSAWARRLGTPLGPPRRTLAIGDRLTVDDISMRVLWPDPGSVPLEPPDGGTSINNVSVVLLGQVGQRRFLLMGDVEEGIDPSIIAEGLPRVDLLKVAHHGSRTATTASFVDTVRPKVAVASAGAGNPYGHPAKATLDRLAAAGARVLRTDRDGTVVVAFEAAGMTVRREGPHVAAVAAPARRDGDRAIAFRCAIPVTALVPEDVPPPATSPVRRSTTETQRPSGRQPAVGYHRSDDGAWGFLSVRNSALDWRAQGRTG